MKRCSTCKDVKAFHQFGRDKSSRDGHDQKCKACRSVSRTPSSKGEPIQLTSLAAIMATRAILTPLPDEPEPSPFTWGP